MLTSTFISKKSGSPERQSYVVEEDTKAKTHTQTPKKFKEGPDFDLLQQYLLDAEDTGSILLN